MWNNHYITVQYIEGPFEAPHWSQIASLPTSLCYCWARSVTSRISGFSWFSAFSRLRRTRSVTSFALYRSDGVLSEVPVSDFTVRCILPAPVLGFAVLVLIGRKKLLSHTTVSEAQLVIHIMCFEPEVEKMAPNANLRKTSHFEIPKI
jgi:hypothetical protein